MFTAGIVTSFKQQILLGQHDLLNDVIKVALYDSSAILGPDTTVYTTVGGSDQQWVYRRGRSSPGADCERRNRHGLCHIY